MLEISSMMTKPMFLSRKEAALITLQISLTLTALFAIEPKWDEKLSSHLHIRS